MKILSFVIAYWVIGLLIAIGYTKICKKIDNVYLIKNNEDFLILLLLWPFFIIGIIIGIIDALKK